MVTLLRLCFTIFDKNPIYLEPRTKNQFKRGSIAHKLYGNNNDDDTDPN